MDARSSVEVFTPMRTPDQGDKLLAHLYSLYQRGISCDVVLAVEGFLEFKAHKVVLSAFSTYFYEVFSSTSNRNTGIGRHNIPDICSNVLGQILEYMYTGCVDLSASNVWHLLAASTQLGITSILDLCQDYMKASSVSAETDCKDDVSAMALIDMVRQMDSGAVNITSAASVQMGITTDNISETEQVPQKPNHGRKPKSRKTLKESCALLSSTYPAEVKLEPFEGTQQTEALELLVQSDSDIDPSWDPTDSKKRDKRSMKGCQSQVQNKTKRTSRQAKPKGKANNKQEKYTSTKNVTTAAPCELPVPRKRGRPRKTDPTESISHKAIKKSTSRKDSQTDLQHVCLQCSEKFIHFSSLKLHEKAHNPLRKSPCKSPWRYNICGLKVNWQKKQQIKCDYKICTRVFKLYSTYRRHFMKTHCPSKRCIKCNIFMRSELSMIRHKIKHHPLLLRIHTSGLKNCFCGRQFVHLRNLKKHKKVHEGMVNTFALKCYQCGRLFKYKKALDSHLTVHGQTFEEERIKLATPKDMPLHKDEGACWAGVKAELGNPLLGLVKDPKKGLEYPYSCPVCDKTFSTTMHLKLHMNMVHKLPVTKASSKQRLSKGSQWTCREEGCTEQYHTHMELRKHILSVHPTVLFHCPLENCKYKTPVHAMMVKHTNNNHNPDKRCEHCGKDFRKKYFLRVHMYAKHGVKDPRVRVHKCPKDGCLYETFQRNILDHHIWRHNTDKMFPCETCGKKLKTELNLKKHINKIHLKIRPYVCDQCGANYGELSELKMHLVRHNKEKQFKCEHCDYESHDKGNYQSHVWAKHKVAIGKKQKTFICNVCDYSCVHKARFDEHMNSHMGIRPHKCPQCDKEFLSRSTMKAHIKWKHLGKTLHCDHCEYRCNTLHFLREHVRVQHTHRHIKPYKCVYCEYTCAISGNCRKHIANRHKGLPIKWVKVCDKWGPNNDKPILAAERINPPSAMYNMTTFNQSVERLISRPDCGLDNPATVTNSTVQYTEDIVAETTETLISPYVETTSNSFSNGIENVMVEPDTTTSIVPQENSVLETGDRGSSQLMYNVYQPEPVVVQGQHDYSQTISFYPIP